MFRFTASLRSRAVDTVKGREGLVGEAQASGFATPSGRESAGCRLEEVGPPLGPDFRAPRRRVPAFQTPRWAPVKTHLAVAGAMEAPVEPEVENEDGESRCGDLCFMDKGLRR